MRATGGDHLEGIKSDSPPVRRHRLADRRGQSLVEFALVLPILLLIVVGILEFGLAFRTFQVVTNAAREGARTAVVGTEQEGVETRVRQYLTSGGLDLSLGDFLFECVDQPGSAPNLTNPNDSSEYACSTGQIARVQVTQPISFVVLGALLNRTVGPPNVRSTSEMRTE